MEHGRDHDERLQKAGLARHRLLPGEDDRDSETASEAHAQERAATAIGGSDVAPTERAIERERLRHQIERDLGRFAAGTEGRLRDRRDPSVTSETLEPAGRLADEEVRNRRDPAAVPIARKGGKP